MAPTMKPTLAEQMYAAFRSNSPDPASLPAWGNLDTDSRVAWMAAADRAEQIVIAQCAEKLDTTAERELAGDGIGLVTEEARGVAWAAQHLRGPR